MFSDFHFGKKNKKRSSIWFDSNLFFSSLFFSFGTLAEKNTIILTALVTRFPGSAWNVSFQIFASIL